MSWNLKNDRPIYSQLVDSIQERIISGVYAPGTRIPSVRELAADASVNPNTMQRAMTSLEDIGLIITNRTSGRMVTEDLEILKSIRDKSAKNTTDEYLNKMKSLGYQDDKIIEIVKEGMK